MAQSHGRGTWATRTVPLALFRCSYTAAEREGNRIGAPAGNAGTARWQVFARAGLWVVAAGPGRHGLLCADVAASLGQPVRLRCGIGRRHAWGWLPLRKAGQAGTRRWLGFPACLALAATAALAGCGGPPAPPAAPGTPPRPAGTRSP